MLNHFNQQSEDFRSDIESCIQSIDKEKIDIDKVPQIDIKNVYASQIEAVKTCNTNISKCYKDYGCSLDNLKQQLQDRLKNLFQTLFFTRPSFDEKKFDAIQEEQKKICDEHKKYTQKLEDKKKDANNELRLNAVARYAEDIGYNKIKDEIDQLKEESDTAQQNQKEDKIKEIEDEIENLKGKLSNEERAIDQINALLERGLGSQAIKFERLENKGEDKQEVRFCIVRDKKTAHHLSEGERSLIAFCYFIVKLREKEQASNKKIVWIDDPVSSLDQNHLFFVYSLIKHDIIDGKDVNQLFLSTHNWQFLTHFHRMKGDKEYFMIVRQEQKSSIVLMPEYIRKYHTEFIFLFSQIYDMAYPKLSSCESDHYAFGNYGRRFLDLYFTFKYPGVADGERYKKLLKGMDQGNASLVQRVVNELSHSKSLEIEYKPLSNLEMQRVAKIICDAIKGKDSQQYEDLCTSIGQPIQEASTKTSKKEPVAWEQTVQDRVAENKPLDTIST